MSSVSGPPSAVVELVKLYLDSTYSNTINPDEIAFDQLIGGLSSAKTWLVESGETRFVLKLWHEDQTNIKQLRWIGKALEASHKQGFTLCARQLHLEQLANRQDENNALVEILTWKSGTPLKPSDNLEVQKEAVNALSRFHRSLAKHSDANQRCSKSIQKRVERLRSLNLSKLPRLLIDYESLHKNLLEKLSQIVSSRFHLQQIQVDSRPDHFLFENGKVTGMIDFGAMAIDTPAIDLARLAGELALGDAIKWETLVSHYMYNLESDFNHELVRLLDLSGALIGIANWQDWISSCQVTPEKAEPRIKTLARRLAISHSQ